MSVVASTSVAGCWMLDVGCCPLSLTTLNALFWDLQKEQKEQQEHQLDLRKMRAKVEKKQEDRARVRGLIINSSACKRMPPLLPLCLLVLWSSGWFFWPLWWQPLYNYLKLKLTVERVGKKIMRIASHRITSQHIVSHWIASDLTLTLVLHVNVNTGIISLLQL